jgi:hypothetical protein
VEKINPDLVARDDEGKPYTVRYEAVNAMLLNEFLKEHRKVEQLTKDFESKLADQQKQIEALTTALQKVSAQVELSKPVPQTVLNNQQDCRLLPFFEIALVLMRLDYIAHFIVNPNHSIM